MRHAKDSFFNPDTRTLLPSLDTAYASYSCGVMSETPQPRSNLLNHSGGKDYASMTSDKDVVTTNELKGYCERLGQQPSQRQRIIIARSCEPLTLDAR